MSHKILKNEYIAAVFNKVCCERVPQLIRRNFYIGFLAKVAELSANFICFKLVCISGRKDKRNIRRLVPQVAVKCGGSVIT